MNFPEKKFEVVFDPSKVHVEQLLAAVKEAGYSPSRHSAVGATGSAGGVTVDAAASEPTLKSGGQGSLVVKLTPPAGQSLSDLVVEASGEAGLEPTAKVEGKAGQNEVAVPVSVASGAKPGQLQATLTVRWKQADQAQEQRLTVPVHVE